MGRDSIGIAAGIVGGWIRRYGLSAGASVGVSRELIALLNGRRTICGRCHGLRIVKTERVNPDTRELETGWLCSECEVSSVPAGDAKHISIEGCERKYSSPSWRTDDWREK